MKRRFEIPLEPAQYNLFEIDDYLRSIQSSKERKKLITTVAFSPELRRDFERKHGLPHGAVEMAMMAEDKRIKEINETVRKRVKPDSSEMSAEEIMTLYRELESMAVGLKALYPEAIQFMLEYGALARRNAASFRGDYQFNNEYKIIRTAACNASGPPPDKCADTNTCWYVNFDYVVNFNLAVFQNVGVLAYVVALYGLILAYALWIVAAAFVIP